MRLAVVAALLGSSLIVSAAKASEGRPDLTYSLGRARLVVSGTAAEVTPYDTGRLTVARVSIDKVLLGKLVDKQVSVVERHDLPSSPQLLQSGEHVVAFLAPAKRNSALKTSVPAGTYYEVVNGRFGVIASTDAASVAEAVSLLSRLIELNRKPEKDTARRAATLRALTFDEIAARHSAVVADGATGLGRIDNLSATLTAEEQTRLETALQRTDLPIWVRVSLVDAVAARGLTSLVPTLRQLADAERPELQHARWTALQRLGAAPSADDLQPALTSPDPATRANAVDALVAAHGTEARPELEQLALRDPNRDVRVAAIEALGKTGTEAMPALERSFGRNDWAERRAAGRAISAVGGRAAQETFARLAFEGPPDAQKYAVTLLFLTGISHDDPLVQRIGQKHPDESVRQIVESGLEVPEH